MADKSKIMLICPMLHQGGLERVCVTTARLLEPYFEVTIVIFNSADIAYDVEGLRIVDLAMGAQKGTVKKIINIVKRSLKVRKLKKEWKPDIAYSFGPTANMVNAFSRTGKEKVWVGLRSYADVNEWVKITLFKKMADLFMCCSKEMEKQLKIKYKINKTAVLYNPYDVEEICRKAAEEQPVFPWDQDENAKELRYFISMGREDDVKCFWHMLKAFSIVHQKVPESRLVIMGDGSFEAYRRLADELGITNAIYFPGMQKEPYKFVKRAEVYLLTSRVEGFPNALVEAMALGLVPVSVNCLSGPAEILMKNADAQQLAAVFAQKQQSGELPVIYGDYGIILPVMEPERNMNAADITQEEKDMAEVLVKLLQNREQMEGYRHAAAERAKIFTYQNYIDQIKDLAAKTSEK